MSIPVNTELALDLNAWKALVGSMWSNWFLASYALPVGSAKDAVTTDPGTGGEVASLDDMPSVLSLPHSVSENHLPADSDADSSLSNTIQSDIGQSVSSNELEENQPESVPQEENQITDIQPTETVSENTIQ